MFFFFFVVFYSFFLPLHFVFVERTLFYGCVLLWRVLVVIDVCCVGLIRRNKLRENFALKLRENKYAGKARSRSRE